MKKCTTFILAVVFLSNFITGQTELSGFSASGGGYATTFLNDYQSLGVNPANLGWKKSDHNFSLGLLEVTTSVYSEALNRRNIVNDLFDNSLSFTSAEKQQMAELFVSARLIGMISVTHLGMSFQDEKIGGIAINIRERIYWQSIFNEDAARFLFLGWNEGAYFDSLLVVNGDTTGAIARKMDFASKIYEGSDINFFHVREFNFGYGRELFTINDEITFYGGINFKYLQGYAGMQYYQFAKGDAVGFSALSPAYDIDYDTYTPSAMDASGLKKAGAGFGVDIGTTINLYNKAKIGLALNDIGSINWDGNVYEGVDVRLFRIKTAGLNNYNIFEEGELISIDEDPVGEDEWRGIKNKSLRLPSNLRAGASYRFNEMIEVGADLLLPLGDKVPGSFESPVFGVGTHYNPTRRVDLSLGIVTGGKFGINIPFGISVFPVHNQFSSWEIGLATRDIKVLFGNNDPTVSACFGFLRFSFGNPNIPAS